MSDNVVPWPIIPCNKPPVASPFEAALGIHRVVFSPSRPATPRELALMEVNNFLVRLLDTVVPILGDEGKTEIAKAKIYAAAVHELANRPFGQ